MKNILHLGSKSKSRQNLLKEANIPYVLVDQDADEGACDWSLSLKEVTLSIALYKMEHVILPKPVSDGNFIYVLTADTLGIDYQGNICGKPTDKQDAINKIRNFRKGAKTGTAFCLDKKIAVNGKWELDTRLTDFVNSDYEFIVPDKWIETYFEGSLKAGIDCMQVSGAVAIEGFGSQFLKSVSGSYTAIVGLPMFELREALSSLDFF